MFSTFWKSLFCTFLFGILFVNIAFTFDVVTMVNPTAVSGDYTNSYFGVSSLVDSFKSFYGNGSGLQGFTDFMNRFGKMITNMYNTVVSPLQFIGNINKKNSAWEIISAIFALIAFANMVVPMILIIAYGLCYLVYLIAFAFTIVAFVIYWFGGGFSTPLPSTDWWEYPVQLSKMVMIVKPL